MKSRGRRWPRARQTPTAPGWVTHVASAEQRFQAEAPASQGMPGGCARKQRLVVVSQERPDSQASLAHGVPGAVPARRHEPSTAPGVGPTQVSPGAQAPVSCRRSQRAPSARGATSSTVSSKVPCTTRPGRAAVEARPPTAMCTTAPAGSAAVATREAKRLRLAAVAVVPVDRRRDRALDVR